jgi:hypothetical protein
VEDNKKQALAGRFFFAPEPEIPNYLFHLITPIVTSLSTDSKGLFGIIAKCS